MQKSYQHEIPKSRVNILLNIEKNGALEKIELPFKMLVMGKFSEKGSRSRIAFRDRINVDKENLNEVLQKISPELSFHIPGFTPDSSELPIQLKFEHYQDFSPEHIVLQVSYLKRLASARNLLKELKSHVLDNEALKQALSEMVKHPDQAKKICEEFHENN